MEYDESNVFFRIDEPFGVLPHNGKKKYKFIDYTEITRTDVIRDLYEHLIYCDKYSKFNKDLVLYCCIKYVSHISEKSFQEYKQWYMFFYGICINKCRKLINNHIEESRLKIRQFISKHIWDVRYNIGRQMFDFRAEQDKIVYLN